MTSGGHVKSGLKGRKLEAKRPVRSPYRDPGKNWSKAQLTNMARNSKVTYGFNIINTMVYADTGPC